VNRLQGDERHVVVQVRGKRFGGDEFVLAVDGNRAGPTTAIVV
jgi:hypothetical protein